MDAPGGDDDLLRAWLRDMPKAELHLHLDGSMRPATALDLASDRGIGIDAEGLDVARMRELLVAPERCRDQAELLRAFDLPTSLLQDSESLERVSAELVEDVASDGTRYAEVRWAPSLHTERGLAMRDGIAAVTRGARAAAARCGIHVRLIVVALRTHDPALASEVARLAAAVIDDGVTGFDLAGREADVPDPVLFAEAFDIARGGGLGISCHAGEWGGAAQVRRALAVRPDRIAHGAPAADDAALMAELRARPVTLDICPTSNAQAGVSKLAPDAPLPRLARAGVPVTLSTDDRTVSDITLVDEMERAVQLLGLSHAELLGLVRQAYAAAFLHHDEPLRASLQTSFEAWAARHPRPPVS